NLEHLFPSLDEDKDLGNGNENEDDVLLTKKVLLLRARDSLNLFYRWYLTCNYSLVTLLTPKIVDQETPTDESNPSGSGQQKKSSVKKRPTQEPVSVALSAISQKTLDQFVTEQTPRSTPHDFDLFEYMKNHFGDNTKDYFKDWNTFFS